MIKTKQVLFVISAVVSLTMSSCYYDNEEDLYPGTNCDTTNVSYTNDIRPLIDQSCAYAGCHAGQFPAALLDLSDYSEVKKIADNGLLINRVNRQSGDPLLMPPTGKLGSCTIQEIEAWVAAGAPQN